MDPPNMRAGPLSASLVRDGVSGRARCCVVCPLLFTPICSPTASYFAELQDTTIRKMGRCCPRRVSRPRLPCLFPGAGERRRGVPCRSRLLPSFALKDIRDTLRASPPFRPPSLRLSSNAASSLDGHVVLSNPKKRNALSLAMLKSLRNDILHEAESKDLKVIVISAEGPVFSSGHDLKELTEEQGHGYHAEVFQTCSEVMMLIRNHPVPVIAMVNGLATAAGCQLVASCDIAMASDKASFATPGVNVGLFCSTPGVALGRAVPRKVALQMLFTGEPISAQEALLHGLVSRVVPEGQLQEETMRVARKIASLSRPVVTLGKAAFYRQLPQDLRTAYHLTSQTMVDNLALPDGQEGITAFLQKRKPIWSH
ncbi:enoyl-CoA hydratase domain-containing protein 3, mitochondrial [Carlito syrichta]|uniref:Enoyl-CoA hydratase domain-containing protein 3, mitochondrial n=1 Tax=Carlito syrichta TaxID=1868482 RepID=A0A3Q0E7P0_CARSF|nr:enoyl-CoA hydratase domain-containing protein 3, mitochondrial [Carlito syrichta]